MAARGAGALIPTTQALTAITNTLSYPYQEPHRSGTASEGRSTLTITHSDATPPAHPSDVLRRLVAEVAQADQGIAVLLAPILVDQPECEFCDPTGPAGVVIATVAIINRFDRLIRRTTCAGCLHDAVVWATSEGRNVTIRAALGDGTAAATS